MRNLGCLTDKFQPEEISLEDLWYMYKDGVIAKEQFDELMTSYTRHKQATSDNQF